MLEFSIRGIILAILLTVLLAISNAYLALKLGILTSASIPAAMISMGILRFFKNSTIFENNAVQTAASAGEAVAGGIVYTIPALIIIGYWHNFDYWTNFFIAFSGGVLGVLFSIPLRKILVHDEGLRFPEGRAIAEILQSTSTHIGLKDLVYAGVFGAALELLQNGLQLIAASWSKIFVVKRTLFAVGMGFSATMIGAGFLVGFDMAFSMILGALIAYGMVLPLASHVFTDYTMQDSATKAMTLLWNNEVRYVGIGAMLCSGVWTFLQLCRPLVVSIIKSCSKISYIRREQFISREERDIPSYFIVLGMLFLAVFLYYFFNIIFPPILMHTVFANKMVVGAVLYVLIVGGLFSIITAYFSAMVGVSASPGSSVVIAGILFAGWLLLSGMRIFIPGTLGESQIFSAEAVVIIVSSIVTGIAAIANDNTQDLKVGQLVGATPWKQQVMLLLGVVISSLVIPPVMQALFDVYGIAGVMPRLGMDVSQSLPAPVASMLAAMTITVFQHALPWAMLGLGAAIILFLLCVFHVFNLQKFMKLSVLGVAIGMYLPLSSSVPLFVGGLISFVVHQGLKSSVLDKKIYKLNIGIRIASGLIAGSALMDVFLSIIFSLHKTQDLFKLSMGSWENYSVAFGLLSTLGLSVWIIQRLKRANKLQV